MFTGLVEEIGTISNLFWHDGLLDLTIACRTALNGLNIGDSICCNGVCLTATGFDTSGFTATATPETLAVTNLGQLTVGSPVNLERSVTLNTRMGGHMVQGHVDGTGTVAEIHPEGVSQRWVFNIPEEQHKFMVHKGSVTINGVSLTIAAVGYNTISVALIPKTIELTTFRFLKPGDSVNIEPDMIGKYVYQFMERFQSAPRPF